MKLNHREFIDIATMPQLPIYLIHGNPKHLQNEVEGKIHTYYKKNNFSGKKNIIVDTDFILEELRKEIEIIPLFESNRIVTLNIVSKTIPQKLKDILIDSKIPDDLKIIIKLDRQPFVFKKTNFYEFCLNSCCIIEIFELKGANLKNWVQRKFFINKLKYSDEIFYKIIERTEGNTLSIAQELYKMSLLKLTDLDNYFQILQNDYKFSEFDLINALLIHDLSKSLKILNHLESVNFPTVYLLFLLNSEIRKIYQLSSGDSKAFIPSYKTKIYNNVLNKVDVNVLSSLIEYCHKIDKTIKTGIDNISTWHQLEILIFCFILNKTIKEFSG